MGSACRWWWAAVVIGVLATGNCRGAAGPDQIRGVKMYLNQDNLQAQYPNYDALVGELTDLGLNALFTTLYEGKKAFYDSGVLQERDGAIDLKKLRDSAARRHVRFGAICQIFYDADTLEGRPDLVPIDQHGDGRFVNWQKLVCPSDPGYRAYKLSIVKEIAEKIHPDVISLDFMRFPTTWELIAPDTRPGDIRNFCFCDRCLTGFQRQSGVEIPKNLAAVPEKAAWILANHNTEWLNWKTGLITSFVAEASREVKRIDPAMAVSVHILPWSERAFDNGLIWNAAQDVAAFAPYVDYLSPMIYHKLIGRPVEYVKELTAELSRKSGKPILPSIQTARILSEAELPAAEFKAALENALDAPSSGTLIFQWGQLRPDPAAGPLREEKRQILAGARR